MTQEEAFEAAAPMQPTVEQLLEVVEADSDLQEILRVAIEAERLAQQSRSAKHSRCDPVTEHSKHPRRQYTMNNTGTEIMGNNATYGQQIDSALKSSEKIGNRLSFNGVRPCRCGSLTHKRVSHSECPLNPRKMRQQGRLEQSV